MSKRRRTSSAASKGQDEDMDLETLSETSRKRKRVDPGEVCQQLYDTIRNFKKEDGGLLCDAFIRAPKRRQEPGYYEVVANPIDLLKVQQKLRTDEYEDVEQLSADIELIVNNAKAFYKRTSSEYRDATELWDLFTMTKNRLLDRDSTPGRSADESGEPSKGKIILKVGKLARKAAAAAESRKGGDDGDEASETSSIAPEDESNSLEELFTAVMMAQDTDGRVLHTVFQLLPSKKRYPEYYEVIDNPIDLKIIATRIQNGQYGSLSDLERDLLQMTKNACIFNEPGSQIYKDAKALRKIISAKKIEIEQGRSSSGKSSERIRNKRLRGSQCLSAVTSALKYEEDDEDEDADDNDEDEPDDEEEEVDEPMDEDEDEEGEDEEGGGEEDEESSPLWQLFESVRGYSSNQGEGTTQQDEGSGGRAGTSPDTSQTPAGYLLSDPFRKLPSKRYYPDYYKEIKNPISLFQIRSKLKQGHYGTLSELAGDLNIMFENAKKYNRPDSRLYKDAVKLQKNMQSKVQELLEYDQDSDSDEDEERSIRRRGPKGPRRKLQEDPVLKKRFLQLYRVLIDHMEDGRQPILMFMEKPSKKLYPDYYQVIEQPIDMLTIEANIKNDKYTSEEQLVIDFKLMFNNCRQYNEEGSVIYEDANKLERLLMEQAQTSPNIERRFTPRAPGPKVKKLQSVLYNKLRILFEAVKEHKDPKGRQLSVIFNKLPSKVEYPDYYEVIKRPIDLERIAQKLKAGNYETLEDMVSDFVLMFDNACKYNEPDSQIYKDALMLQRVTLQTKLQLREDEDVPDVPAAVQEMLTSLFTATYNHQDEEGRCFSDSMAELPEHDDVDGKKVRALSLDLIKRRLDRNLYKRLDLFQEDMFACFDRARRLSRSDSQVFEDAIELQAYFIKQRDELCRGGDLLHSPALRYSAQELAASLETLRQEKALRELPEEEGETRSSEDSFKEQVATQGDEMSFNQQLYRVGDFVYLEPKERGMEPHIIHIERLWTNQDNQQMLFGNYFYRPNETYHVTTRKFLEKEVFKSDVRAAIPLQQVVGVCYVLFVRDYLKLRPEGIPDKDVYVCESRYATKPRSFKKIKIWPYTLPDHIPLVPREEPLEPKRVMSVFRERVEKHKEEIAELEEGEKLPERESPPNVEIFNPQGTEGYTYYEQYQVSHCDSISSVKTGDCVYVQTSPGCKCVAQVDCIWVTKEGEAFFKGPWFVPPSEVPHENSRLFYKQELFLSSLEDSHLINDILGRCAVLEHGEYISCRPTEVAEQDVYICESLYVEARRQDHKLGRDGLKKYQHTGDVVEDEIYFFRRLINPAKVGSEGVIKTETKFTHYERDASPLTSRDPEASLLMEDSMDGGPPSVGSGDTPTPSPSMPTPVSSKKKGTGKKLVTGYILYSSDVRKSISGKFPDSTFGEISRIVGNEWRNLPAQEKATYEERAARMNEETSARLAQEASNAPGETVNPDIIYECLWDGCDWQFEELNDLIEHCVSEPGGHVQQHFVNNPDSEFQCQWKGCIRQKKTVPPFPNLVRLVRHTKEQHIQKGNGKAVPGPERSRNFIPARKSLCIPAKTSGAAQHTQQGQNHFVASSLATTTSTTPASTAAPVRQLEPMFVSVPPRPQRLLHSEAYIKYIEGLASETKHISNWDKHLKATPENTSVPDASKLPSQWLGNGVGNHGTIVNALWALRDFMIRDALGLTKSS